MSRPPRQPTACVTPDRRHLPSTEEVQEGTESDDEGKGHVLLTGAVAAQYGRDSLGEITREVEGKAEEEVREYSRTFWERGTELADWERVSKNIGARCSPARLTFNMTPPAP